MKSGDTVYRQAAIDALGDAHFKNYGNAIMVIQSLPSAQPEQKLWKERYEDLLDYMHGEDTILKDRKEFKAWLERCRWHVLECDKLARQLESQPEQKWIPVSERLPDDDRTKVVTLANGNVEAGYYSNGDWWCIGDTIALENPTVIAWMPLPEAYAERREE